MHLGVHYRFEITRVLGCAALEKERDQLRGRFRLGLVFYLLLFFKIKKKSNDGLRHYTFHGFVDMASNPLS